MLTYAEMGSIAAGLHRESPSIEGWVLFNLVRWVFQQLNNLEPGRLKEEVYARLQHAALEKEASGIQTVDACMFIRFLREAELEPLLVRIKKAIKEFEARRDDFRAHP